MARDLHPERESIAGYIAAKASRFEREARAPGFGGHQSVHILLRALESDVRTCLDLPNPVLAEPE